MRKPLPADWLAPPDLKAASVAQREIAALCEMEDRFGPVRIVAGADTSMKWRDSRGPIHAAIASMMWPPRDRLPASSITAVPDIPYVPGYLGFRESPALVAAWEALPEKPDLILVDGHGRPHPRRCGIATHLGVVLDVPTIGCAKSLLCGKVEGDLGEAAGSIAPLVDRGEIVGVALRTRAKCLPIYVSTGHRISLESAVAWVLKLCDGRRLPVPIRMAHDAANAARRAAEHHGEA
ncbi:endonuclease V [Sphingobium boeckii]|uniref:Endonuclease V n=1 Tax=Sphingobium boeckii TaxID=1082345 RepID=A0A7W9EEB4_9SPHN|nr:endonuclease V [Sphingobium boeckii]MBB5686012.1 deoxyribonuclease V [Sphingobium boeckii]